MTDCARVLVVDDDADLLHATSRLLRNASYEVIEARTGSDGLRLAREKKPDLILLDVVLPDTDGIEVCRQIKANADLTEIHVVLLSAFQTAPDDQAYGLEAGADGYIVRPITNRELLARVESTLRLKQAEDSLRERTHQLEQRVKELNCLYGISQLVQSPDISLEEVLQGAVALIPPAWHYPEITCARIILEEQEFKTEEFEETIWRQTCDIKVRGNLAGRVEVYYLEERPELDEGPFLEEERKLLSAIAERLGRVIERMRAQAALQESEATARALLNAPTDIVVLIDTQGFILDANETMACRFDRAVDELVGMCAWDLFPPQVVERRKAYVDQVIQTSRPVRFEDGRGGIWNDNLVYPVLDTGGQVTKVAVLARDITERVRMEDALRKSEERFRGIFEQSQDGIALTDEAGLVIEWNEAMEEITGLKAEEVLGKPVWDVQFQVILEEQRTQERYRQLKGMILQALESGQAPWLGQLSEYEYQHRDGTRRIMQWVVFPIQTEEGVMMSSIARDITERVRAEEAIRTEKEFSETVFDTVMDTIFVFDPNSGEAIRWNKVFNEITGYTDVEISSKRAPDDWYDIEDLAKSRIETENLLKGEQSLVEMSLIAKDGRRIPTEYTATLIRDPEGNPQYIVAVGRDITERMQAQEALRESEQKYRELFEQTLIGIISSGRDGRIKAVNPAVLDILGYGDQEELVGQPAETIWIDPAERSRELHVAIELGYLPVQEVKLRKKDGTPVYGLATATIDQDREGQLLDVTATFTDISELKKAEQALQRSEQRYGRLLETLQEGIWIIDHDARTTFANPRLAEMLGYSVEEMRGKTLFDFTDERGVELCNYYLERRRRGIKEQHDFEFLRKNGDRMYASLGASPIFDDDGNYAGVIAGVQDITDRIQTEEVLAETTRLLETIFEHTHVLVAYLDPGFNFVRVNRAYAEADKREPSFFPGQNHFDLYPNPENEEIFRRVAETGQPHFAYAKPFEYAEHLERGVSYWDWSLIPIKDLGGSLTGLILTLANVTERVRAQQALWESEERFHLAFDSANVGQCLVDLQGKLMWVNRAMCDIFGYSQEELESKTVNDITHPDYLDVSPQFIERATSGEVTRSEFEKKYFHKEGHLVWCQVSSALVRDPEGMPLYFISHVVDVTRRKQAEEALRESEEKYRDLVEEINDVMYTIDAEGVITYINPAIESFVGYSPSEVIGRPFIEYIAPEDLENIRDNFQKLYSGNTSGPNEYRVVTKSGDVRWIRTSSQPIIEGDKTVGVRGVLTDITDRKRAEKHLEEAAATAERERLARELHDAVTQVLFSASLIADTLPRVWALHPEEGQHGLEELRRLTHGALAEMRALLLELRPGALSEQDLGVLLRQLTDGMMARTRMPVATTVIGDRCLSADVQIALYRIAQEALNNIAKHARASRATVSLDNEPECVTLCISDDGCGFDPDSVQAHQMGIQIMQERAQAIGATISIESRPDQGTEITVTWSGDSETKYE